jgi:hypothetical protein
LPDNIPDVVDYKDYDTKLYKHAGKRTTTEDSEKILFHALGINLIDAQLMILAFILQKYLFTNIFHPSTPASTIY